MKLRKTAILAILSLVALFSCKKDTDVNMDTFKIVKEVEKVTAGTTTATITGMYEYSGRIDGIKVRVGTSEQLFGSDVFVAEVSGKAYSVNITGLRSGTLYHYRYEVDYGAKEDYLTEIYDFTTQSESPTVKTLSVQAIDSITYRVKCEVVANGGSDVTERGICWNTYGDPTLDDETEQYDHPGGTIPNHGIGQYTIKLENLPTSTRIFVRAYSKNDSGIGLGDTLSFRTGGNVTKPQVSTVAVSDTTYNTATCLCNVISDGGMELSERGVCWGLESDPTVNVHKVPAQGTEIGNYSVTIDGLNPSTEYHVRAYAINEKGVAYGEDLPFKTTDGKPTVTTAAVTNITATSATGGGNVTDEGASHVAERGICWSTSHEPMATGTHLANGTGAGSFLCNMPNLTPNETYYVRAYATNGQGTAYGAEVEFMAKEGLPVVVTLDVTDITTTSAKAHGKVIDQGGSQVTERGICWGTEPSPSISGTHAQSGTGLGEFEVNLTDLAPGTHYYVRAYAINNQGMTYGGQEDFTTLATKPTVVTGSISGTTVSGEVTDEGGATVTERGVCWSTEHNPTIDGSHGSSGSGLGTFMVELPDLAPGTTYYVKAYATNSAGTAYGSEKPLKTEANPPTVITNDVSNIQQNSALGGGNVTDDGGADVTERGVCWSTSSNPTIANSHAQAEQGGLGNFTVPMTSLTANTHYYVRAYAKNREGKIGYGGQVEFNTAQSISAPTVTTTSPVTNITQTSATGGGNVTSDGGSPVTERGICWSTSHTPTISGSHANNGTGTGSYEVNMTGLTAGTQYYVRAYAINDAGLIGYGSEVPFTTQQPTTYTVTVSASPSNGGSAHVGSTTGPATGTYNQGQSCTVYAIANSGYYFANWTENGSVVSSNANYTFTVNGNRTLRANFTQIVVPTVTTNNATNIQQTTATGGGNVTNSGGATVTERGICWSTSPNPSLTNGSHQQASSGGTGSFTVPMTGLTPGTHYYVRAYATNSAGTGYGSQKEFDTQTQQYTITVSANPSNGGSVTGGGTYNQGASCTVTATPASNYTFANWTENGNVASTQANYTFTVTGNRTLVANFNPNGGSAPLGAINGQFTINSNGDKVYFSKGNLQYIGSASTPYWKFADNQWDYLGTTTGQNSTNQNVDRDLFGWGTSGYNHGANCYQPWSTSTNNSDYYAYGNWQYNLYDQNGQADWGYNPISYGGNQTNQWRTLTQPEWDYVFNNPQRGAPLNGTDHARYAKAVVENVHGVILFPDSYTHPSGVAQPIGINQTGNTGWNGNNYTAIDFGFMQDAGAVFLPAAGSRGGTSVNSVGSYGYYWSASYNGSNGAYGVGFNDSNLGTYDGSRYFGRSVRLVRVAEN
jgi:hypothetical protein